MLKKKKKTERRKKNEQFAYEVNRQRKSHEKGISMFTEINGRRLSSKKINGKVTPKNTIDQFGVPV